MKKNAPLKNLLFDCLRCAGDILRRHFGRAKISYKGRANLVTQADRASEAAILKMILRRFPDHDYLTEESRPRRRGAEFTWVIDPVDGTTNYAHGYPAACVSIGILQKGEPLLGGVYDPFRDELFFAERGRGARLNGKRMRVSNITRVRESLLLTGFAYDRLLRSHFYIEFYRTMMTKSHDVRRSGSAALDLAWVASGRADGFWEFNLNPWDVAAGMLLVCEAGGAVTDFLGRCWPAPEKFGFETLATNGKIHREMLRILSSPPLWKGSHARRRGEFQPIKSRIPA